MTNPLIAKERSTPTPRPSGPTILPEEWCQMTSRTAAPRSPLSDENRRRERNAACVAPAVIAWGPLTRSANQRRAAARTVVSVRRRGACGTAGREAAKVVHLGPVRAAAEREGFEPSDEVDPRHTISSRARSAAPAPLPASGSEGRGLARPEDALRERDAGDDERPPGGLVPAERLAQERHAEHDGEHRHEVGDHRAGLGPGLA